MNDNQRLLDETLFTYQGMSYQEMQFYLNNIIKNCKDISDTDNKVDNKKTCDIVEMRFKKNDNIIYFNGSISLASENRCVDGYIRIQENNIQVNMHITRLCVECDKKEYKVFDEFRYDNKQITRQSYYDYNIQNSYEFLEYEKERGKTL